MSHRPNGKALSRELAKLAAEVYTVTDAGDSVTREQALADMIWKQALGWTEVTRDDSGNLVKKVHPPVAWCQQFLFERMEGKAPIAAPDNQSGMRASERVGELAKQRLNQIAAIKAGPPKAK